MTTYLDHAATTPMLPEVIEAIGVQLKSVGNPSSLHASGRAARRAVEEAREQLGDALDARPSEVIFTGGGTESDNLAVKGIYWARRAADPRRRRIVAGSTEHHAVLDAVEWLATHEGADVTWLDVDAVGRVRPETLRAALAESADEVALVTVMWANNEVGTVQPVRELAEIAHEYAVPLHTDAVQAVGAVPVSFAHSGADALSLTAHKLGGPYAVGALLLRREVECVPLQHGGGQERDVRSGTVDRVGVVGLAVAAETAVRRRPEVAARLVELREAMIAGIRREVPDAVFNGDRGDGRVDGGPSRLPGNVHVSFPGCAGDALLMLLDARGIECSTGSACSAGVAEPSHVLLAMGADEERAKASLRFSLGHTSVADDVAALVGAIGPAVERARRAGLTR